jgi:hypothetical protein
LAVAVPAATVQALVSSRAKDRRAGFAVGAAVSGFEEKRLSINAPFWQLANAKRLIGKENGRTSALTKKPYDTKCLSMT